MRSYPSLQTALGNYPGRIPQTSTLPTMLLADLESSPPSPQQVITPWADSRGQDLLGLRAPAERIAVSLMNGVTTISPLIRYLGFRSWVIRRYTDLRGPNDTNAFNAFAGKCEAALVIGHKLAELPTLRMVGADRATEELEQASVPLARRLTKILAMDTYAGPSQDLGLAIRRDSVPSLSTERGLPLAHEVNRTLEHASALMGLDVSAPAQPLDHQQAIDLARAFTISAPSGAERQMLIDAVCPAKPRAGEHARLAAYCYLLHLAERQNENALDEDEVFQAAIDGSASVLPQALDSVTDGWLKFLVRDSFVVTHERAVAVALGLLDEAPNHTATINTLMRQIEQIDPGPVLNALGLTGFGASTPIRELCDAVEAGRVDVRVRGGLNRWSGGLDEMAVIRAFGETPEPEVVALLPVAWNLNAHRTWSGGDVLDLGGVHNFVHARQPGTTIRLKAEFSIEVQDLPLYLEGEVAVLEPDQVASNTRLSELLQSRISSAAVELEIVSDNGGHIQAWRTWINGEPVGVVRFDRMRPHAELTEINWSHPVLLQDTIDKRSAEGAMIRAILRNQAPALEEVDAPTPDEDITDEPVAGALVDLCVAVGIGTMADSVSRAQTIDVDVNGDLVDPWPDDFFEQDFKERFS